MSDAAPRQDATIAKRTTHWSVYAIDRGAGAFIRVGGLMVILAVIAIIVFIASEAFPLFQSAKSGETNIASNAGGFDLTPENAPLLNLSDSNRRLSLTLTSNGEFLISSLSDGSVVRKFTPSVLQGKKVVSASVSPRPRRVISLSRPAWQVYGQHRFDKQEDGNYRFRGIEPSPEQTQVSADASSVMHFLTNYFDAAKTPDGKHYSRAAEDFETTQKGVPAYSIAVLLDDGSIHHLRAAFYSQFQSFDPRFVPEKLSRLTHPSEDEFKEKAYRPDSLIMKERRIRGESAASVMSGSEQRDTDGRVIRYRVLADLPDSAPSNLLKASSDLEAAYQTDLAYFPHWYAGEDCLVEKLPGYGQDRGRALLLFRSTSVDIALEAEVLGATTGKAVSIVSDELPEDFADDDERRSSSPKVSVGTAYATDENRAFVVRRSFTIKGGVIAPNKFGNEIVLHDELLPNIFTGHESEQAFSAPIAKVLVAVPENRGFAPAALDVVLEDGWVFPYLLATSGWDTPDAKNEITPRAKAYNVISGRGKDGSAWPEWLDDRDALQADLRITQAARILGDTTLLFGDSRGGLQAWFPVPNHAGDREYERIRGYEPAKGAIETIAISQKSKAFLVSDKTGVVRGINMTTARHFFEEAMPTPFVTLHYGREGDGLYGWDTKQHFHAWWFDAPHADASLASFFTKLHYEHFEEPKFEWQSTGLDESEPKFSLVPLIIGTLKGALYAMLFSIPIAIAAAVYTSEFMSARLRNIVKPIMEVMASLPSVVLGFVAALVLAPMFEAHVTSVLAFVGLTPFLFLLYGWLWQQLPPTITGKLSPVGILLTLLLILSLGGFLAFQIGPRIEPLLFPSSESAAAGDLDPMTFEPLTTGRADAEVVDGKVVTPAERLERGNILPWSSGGIPTKSETTITFKDGEKITYPSGWWVPGGTSLFSLLLVIPVFLVFGWLLRLVFTGGRLMTRPLHLWKDTTHALHPQSIAANMRRRIQGSGQNRLRPVIADLSIDFLRLAIVGALSISFVALFADTIASLFFTYDHPSVGRVVDFRRFIVGEEGWAFNPQVNSMIVAAAMGFAVIPIIYTISEDALSTVPNQLRAASLGCGASPWQTATKVVLPAALPGIFSAVVIGLGRAIGETMIVLMAAGGKPVQDWNPLGGFQSLSAAIATEIPEAPKDGTLYRTLFLAGVLLFAMTFVLNTIAEIVRLRLRRKMARV